MREAGASPGPNEEADGPSAAADADVPASRSGRRWRRPLALTALALAGLLVLVAAGGFLFVRHEIGASFPRVSGSLRVAGLDGRVEVDRDAQGIPQVYASTGHDLMFAQGYVQAQDRFWQMDVYRHAAAGQLSAMFGAGQVRTDEFIRTMGWREQAEQNYALLSPASRRYLTAYADGVNAYLTDHHGAGLSFEYLALGLDKPYSPPRWTPVDSVGWLLALAWDLRDNIRTEIERALSAATLSSAQVDQLFSPPLPDANRPILPHGTVTGGAFTTGQPAATPAAGAATVPAEALPALRRLADTIAAAPGDLMPDNSGAGSNSWVVSGQHTTTGMPLLANDPHLGPELPSIWYQMGLHCVTASQDCPFEVTGFTMPGTPGVLIGHNDHIAWGFTNGSEDVTDLYLEKVSGDRYLWNGAWYPLTTRTEVIKVAGGKPVTITVRATRHGPLVSDVNSELAEVGRRAPAPSGTGQASRDGGYAVALRWTALEPNRTADALFELDTAQDWTGFRAAAADFSVPSQNMVYADTRGNIGYQTPGQIPIRKSGDGRWPVPGWTDAYEWTGYIPFAELPSAYNPPQGYLVTANNQIVPPTDYPYLLSKDFDYGYRAAEIQRRIDQDIAGGRRVSPAEMSAIQLDQTNPMARTLVPYLRAVPVDPDTAKARELFTGWDFDEPADSAAAAYFNQVWVELLRTAFASKLPKDVDVSGESSWFAVVQNLLGDPTSPWWDDPSTPARENRDALLARALTAARARLAQRYGPDPRSWRWGTMHTLTPTHQTLGANGPAPLRWLLNGERTPLGGGSAIVDANGFDAAKGFAVTQVPSMRMVVDTRDLDASRWINLTGASGHVSDPHYLDQFSRWRTGQTLAWPFSRGAVRAATTSVLTLHP
jgi:penicillin amidase